MKKICCILLWMSFLLAVGSISVFAESIETMPQSYVDVEEYLPDDVLSLLPDGMFSQDPSQALQAAESMTRPEYLIKLLFEAAGLGFSEVLSLFVMILSVVLLSALLRKIHESLTGGGESVAFFLRLVLYALIVSRAGGMIARLKTYFTQLSALMTGLLPMMGSLYALGGNVTQAAAGEGVLLICLQIIEYATAYITPVVCGSCLAFALLDAFGGGMQVRFAPMGALIKKWYMTLLGFVMFLLGVGLSAQSVLTSTADSLGMKGIKYAVTQMIPVVGGAISGTLGTVGGGIGMLRRVTGISGLILVGLLLLPTLVQLFLFRICYQAGAALASMLGCDSEAGLLNEVSGLYGYMIAAAVICSVVIVLALSVFAHSAVALG